MAALLAAAIAMIMALIVFSRRDSDVVPALILAWVIFPNRANHIIGVFGYPAFLLLELLLIAVVLLRLYYAPPFFRGLPSILKVFIVLSVGGLLVQYSLGTLYIDALYPAFGEDFWLKRLSGFLGAVSGLMILLACGAFIKSEDDLRRAYSAVLIAGCLISAELMATLWVPGVRSAIGGETIKAAGGFFSIFLNDFHAVSLVSGAASIAGVGLWRVSDQSRYLFWGAFAAMPALFNIGTRAQILGTLVGIGTVIFFSVNRRWKYILGFSGVAALLVMLVGASVLESYFAVLGVKVFGQLSDDGRSQILASFLSGDSMHARIGLWTRTLEVIRELFPFGAGEETIGYYLNSSSVQEAAHFSNWEQSSSYQQTQFKIKEVHNGYLNIVASYGALGLATLLTIGWGLLNGLRDTLTRVTNNLSDQTYAIGLGLFALLSVFYVFNSYPYVYVIFQLAVFVTLIGPNHLTMSPISTREQSNEDITNEDF